jgi:hypothetical protein
MRTEAGQACAFASDIRKKTRRSELRRARPRSPRVDDQAIRRALEFAGVEFIDAYNGVRECGCGAHRRRSRFSAARQRFDSGMEFTVAGPGPKSAAVVDFSAARHCDFSGASTRCRGAGAYGAADAISSEMLFDPARKIPVIWLASVRRNAQWRSPQTTMREGHKTRSRHPVAAADPIC